MQSLALRPALLAGRVGMLQYVSGAEPALARAAAAVASAGVGCPTLAGVRCFSAPTEDQLRKAEKMVEMMASSPALQQMMMSVMPAPLRNADILKQLFNDPAMKKRISEMIAKRGLPIPDHLLERMTPGAMDDTFARAQRLGIDPGALFTKLMQHPLLLAKLQQPRVMTAFLDIAEDPSRQSKYADDKELLDVVFKVRELLATTKTAVPPPAGPSTTTAAASSEPSASAIPMPPPPGTPARSESSDASSSSSNTGEGAAASASGGSSSFNPLVALMSSDPKAARWLENPKVMAALEEVHKSPWKTVKYVFDRDVMEAFKDLKELMRGKKL
ncbi:hypothetical protein HYH02_002907 [Chlamydomonas schloesseri]|uniref:Uncharacterized protein n=1 Tax=Chlamydomonas schloesseri TaxID=2026947 RepID=A0A835WSP0_9CHLO|nr:hypothetical protein HYH02_002907 [Chlamydomonas schloesseri]|eukprot:KAG2452674.1 hypothetical protein HYH02_002907 [Chlamydomonas schloesseri]